MEGKKRIHERKQRNGMQGANSANLERVNVLGGYTGETWESRVPTE